MRANIWVGELLAFCLVFGVGSVVGDDRSSGISAGGDMNVTGGDGGDVTLQTGDGTINVEKESAQLQADTTNTNTATTNVNVYVQRVLDEVPEEQREVAAGIADIAEGILEGSESPENEEKRNALVEKLSEFSLVSYDAAASPFAPPVNKAQFMCDRRFVFVDHGRRIGNHVYFMVNGQDSGRVSPGSEKTFEADDMVLSLLFLEYSEEKEAPILKYSCTPRKK